LFEAYHNTINSVQAILKKTCIVFVKEHSTKATKRKEKEKKQLLK